MGSGDECFDEQGADALVLHGIGDEHGDLGAVRRDLLQRGKADDVIADLGDQRVAPLGLRRVRDRLAVAVGDSCGSPRSSGIGSNGPTRPCRVRAGRPGRDRSPAGS